MTFLRRLWQGGSAANPKVLMEFIYPKNVTWTVEDVQKLESDGLYDEALNRWKILLTAFQYPNLPHDFLMLPFHRFIYLHIGMCCKNLERYPEALEAYAHVVALAQQANDQSMLAEVGSSIGIVHRRRGDFAAAFEQYKQALDKATSLKEWNLVAVILDNLSVIYLEQGDEARSFAEATRAHKLIQQHPRHVTALVQSRILGNLGTHYSLRGEIRKARQLLESGLARARESGSRQQEAIILEALGKL
jgi:tetratricopeptide (TPR) repeat protein